MSQRVPPPSLPEDVGSVLRLGVSGAPAPSAEAEQRLQHRLAATLGLPVGLGLGLGGSGAAPAGAAPAMGEAGGAAAGAGAGGAAAAGAGAAPVAAALALKPVTLVLAALGLTVGAGTIAIFSYVKSQQSPNVSSSRASQPVSITTGVAASEQRSPARPGVASPASAPTPAGGEVSSSARARGPREEATPSSRPSSPSLEGPSGRELGQTAFEMAPLPAPRSGRHGGARRLRHVARSSGATPKAAERQMAPPQISAPATSSIGEEGALLQRAREALGRGRFDAAEQAIAEHRRRFVVGQLVEEREALWIRVLAGRGELQRAQAAAERFRHGYPRSILLPVVDEALRRGP